MDYNLLYYIAGVLQSCRIMEVEVDITGAVGVMAVGAVAHTLVDIQAHIAVAMAQDHIMVQLHHQVMDPHHQVMLLHHQAMEIHQVMEPPMVHHYHQVIHHQVMGHKI